MSLNDEHPADGEGQVEKGTAVGVCALIGTEQLYHLNVVLPSGPATRTIKIFVPRMTVIS